MGNATQESCKLISYNTQSCSCGTMCSSFSREYFATCESKCGDQILRTGEFGKEKCDIDDFFAKDMKKTYTVMVMPCSNGEFAFTNRDGALHAHVIGLPTVAAVLMTVYYVAIA